MVWLSSDYYVDNQSNFFYNSSYKLEPILPQIFIASSTYSLYLDLDFA